MHKHPTPAEIQAAIVKAMIEMAVKENISTHTVSRMTFAFRSRPFGRAHMIPPPVFSTPCTLEKSEFMHRGTTMGTTSGCPMMPDCYAYGTQNRITIR